MSHSSIDIIKNAIRNNKLSHAYLFYGDKGVDVERPILDSIEMILNSHGKQYKLNDLESINYYDFKFIKPTLNNKIKKEMVDSTINLLFDTPLEENGIKFLYIKDVHLGNKSSLNRLLKFIEDPVENLVIFMSTNHFDGVLSTIKSRTQNIYVKRESLETKIKKFTNVLSKNEQDYLSLLANIYSNVNDLKSLNLDLFIETYNGVLSTLQKAAKNKYLLKIELSKIWNKQNSFFVLNILQFFYYQVMTNIDKKYPLFPKYDSLIMEYKTRNFDYFLFEEKIDKLKRNLIIYGNFELQKTAFLNELEGLY